MKRIYCIECNKHRKFKNVKISFIFNEILVLSIICGKCGSNKIESIEIINPNRM